MNAAPRDDEWDQLRAERAAARAALVGSLDALEARARDPFRLKERMRKHPVLVTGIAAGAGALLVQMLLGGRTPEPPGTTPEAGTRPRDRGPDFIDKLRDAAVRMAIPWVARFAEEHLAKLVDVDETGATNGSETERPSD